MAITIKQTRVVDVPVTTISACLDTLSIATLHDAEGRLTGQAGTPDWLPQVLEIDLETGRIVNWKMPTVEQLQYMADGHAMAMVPEPDVTAPSVNKAIIEHSDRVVALEQEWREIPASHPVITTPEIAQPIDVAAPVQAVPVETAPESQQHNPVIDIELPADFVVAEPVLVAEPVAKKPSVDIGVSFNKESGKWVADVGNDEVGEHSATSQQGKFEAIKNVLKKAGLLGVYEINQRDLMDDVEFYSYDGSRTLNADTVYMTQGADGSWSARMPNNKPITATIGIDGSLTALLKEMEGIKPEDAVIVETTDDEMRSKCKRRYAVTSRHEYVNTPETMLNALHLVSTTYGLSQCDALACIASGLVKLAPGKSEKDIGENSMGVLQLTERGNELFSILDRSGIDQDAAAEALKAYLLKDPSFDQLMVAIDACKTPIGLGCIKMHIESLHDKQMQGALHDEINRRMPHMSVAAQKTQPTPEPSAPPTYTEVMAAIEYAATEIHAAKLVNTINGGGFDFDQRTRLHAALNTRIKQIKAAELA